jgi:hypothetical protein
VPLQILGKVKLLVSRSARNRGDEHGVLNQKIELFFCDNKLLLFRSKKEVELYEGLRCFKKPVTGSAG